MRPYAAIFAARVRLLFQYRAAAFAGVCTQFFWGIMHVMIFTAFYAHVQDPASLPMTLNQAITYTWLVQAFLVFLPWNIDRDVEALVRSGNVVYELTRPIDLYGIWFARALAWRMGPGLLRVVPIFALALCFSGFQLPQSPLAATLFLLSLAAGLLLGAAITTLMMLSLFWTLSSAGVVRLMIGLVVAFSGMQVPLPFYPEWAQPLLSAMPFRGLMDTPFRIYLGHIAPENVFLPLLHQFLWIGALMALGRYLMSIAQRRLVIQGG